MKYKITLITLFTCLSSILMCGCGSGITQDDYDAILAQLESAETEIENLEAENNLLELKIDLIDILASKEAEINSQYEATKLVCQALETIGSEDVQAVSTKIDSVYTDISARYTTYRTTIDNTSDPYKLIELKSSVEYASDEWDDFYSNILNIWNTIVY